MALPAPDVTPPPGRPARSRPDIALPPGQHHPESSTARRHPQPVPLSGPPSQHLHRRGPAPPRAHLGEGFSLGSLPHLDQLAALVMVFNMSDESSFLTLQNWVANVDVQRFEVLLCIGNKADLVPDHGAHVEYRRRVQRNDFPLLMKTLSNDEYTDDESSYEFEYEVLSHGSDEQ